MLIAKAKKLQLRFCEIEKLFNKLFIQIKMNMLALEVMKP